jgi:hypothetical protein
LKADTADSHERTGSSITVSFLSKPSTYLLAAHLTPPTAGCCLRNSYLTRALGVR